MIKSGEQVRRTYTVSITLKIGIGITRDLEKAIEMFKKAADAGDPEGKAMYNMYLKNK